MYTEAGFSLTYIHCMCRHMCTHTYTCMYTHIHICIYMYTHARIHTHIYTHNYTHNSQCCDRIVEVEITLIISGSLNYKCPNTVILF